MPHKKIKHHLITNHQGTNISGVITAHIFEYPLYRILQEMLFVLDGTLPQVLIVKQFGMNMKVHCFVYMTIFRLMRRSRASSTLRYLCRYFFCADHLRQVSKNVMAAGRRKFQCRVHEVIARSQDPHWPLCIASMLSLLGEMTLGKTRHLIYSYFGYLLIILGMLISQIFSSKINGS